MYNDTDADADMYGTGIFICREKSAQVSIIEKGTSTKGISRQDCRYIRHEKGICMKCARVQK